MGIEYDGSEFSGWQRLSKHGEARPEGYVTLQSTIEAALSFVAGVPIETICAGRTDAGVHAAGQVIHFDSPVMRDPRGWVLGRPASCRRRSVPCGACRCPRSSMPVFRPARAVIATPSSTAPCGRRCNGRTLTWERRPLDTDAMHRAAQALLGENDFSAFRTVQCQAPHARRELQEISVFRDGDLVSVEVQANAFLHHMVRNIVGSLLVVGRGEQPERLDCRSARRTRPHQGGANGAAEWTWYSSGPRYPAEIVDCPDCPPMCACGRSHRETQRRDQAMRG